MSGFVLALGAFVFIHVGLSATGLRRALVGRIGEGPYRIAFSLASAGLIAWLVIAYGQMRANPFDPLNQPLWAPPDWGRRAAHTLVLLGFLLGVGGLMTPGPTLAGFEGTLKRDEPAKGLLRVTRHPFLWGVALWGFGHLAANGERFALMLFGGLALMVLLGTRSIDRKGAARDPEGWARFAAVTSNVPFAAIAQGRNKLALGEIWLPLLVGAAAFAGMAFAHPILFGAPAFP